MIGCKGNDRQGNKLFACAAARSALLRSDCNHYWKHFLFRVGRWNMHSNQSLCEEDRFVIDMRLFKVKSALMVNHAAVRISLGTVTFLVYDWPTFRW
jgi:hypothetical protein